MTKSQADEFIEIFSCEDTCAIFRGQKYYFNGCQTSYGEAGNIIKVSAEVYTIPQNETVFYTEKASTSECIEAFLDEPIFDGKKFYEVYSEFQFTDDWS